MKINKISFFVIFFLAGFSCFLFAQKESKANDGLYKKEMKFLQLAIQKNFYDKAYGYYFVKLDPAKRKKKGDFIREYTYLWSLCAMYQAANEIEKLDPAANLMEPLLTIMNDYYDPLCQNQIIQIIS